MMEQFVYLIRPMRDNFIETMTQGEEEIMDRHFEYLKSLLAKDTLILAGPCLDGAFGIVVFVAESMDEARKVMDDDPSVVAGIMHSELHAYRVSLMQGR